MNYWPASHYRTIDRRNHWRQHVNYWPASHYRVIDRRNQLREWPASHLNLYEQLIGVIIDEQWPAGVSGTMEPAGPWSGLTYTRRSSKASSELSYKNQRKKINIRIGMIEGVIIIPPSFISQCICMFIDFRLECQVDICIYELGPWISSCQMSVPETFSILDWLILRDCMSCSRNRVMGNC